MTLRVCIIGNSHVAALRQAWAAEPGRWPMQVRFVAGRQDLMAQTRVQDGFILPCSPATARAVQATYGAAKVPLRAQDAFVIVGCAVALQAVLPLYRDAVWPGLSQCDKTPPRQTISRAAATASAQAVLAARLGARLAGMLGQATTQPVFAAPQPRISDHILTVPRPDTRLHRVAVLRGDAAAVSVLFDTASRQLFAQAGAEYLPQPAATLSSDVLTAHRFVRGAGRLDQTTAAPQPKDDIHHGNAAYGALVLDQIAAALADLKPAPRRRSDRPADHRSPPARPIAGSAPA